MHHKELTRAEEQIMQIIWRLEKCYVNDILEAIKDSKPAYTTVSTIVRLLENKGFVGHELIGRAHLYYPLISKTSYRKSSFKQMMVGYFENNYHTLTNFFTKEEDLSLEQLEEIQRLIDTEIKRKTDG